MAGLRAGTVGAGERATAIGHDGAPALLSAEAGLAAARLGDDASPVSRAALAVRAARYGGLARCIGSGDAATGGGRAETMMLAFVRGGAVVGLRDAITVGAVTPTVPGADLIARGAREILAPDGEGDCPEQQRAGG